MADADALRALLERVEAATGPLDPETACRVHALGQGDWISYLGEVCGDGGAAEHEYEVAATPSRYAIVYVLERDLPDRSLDAVVALAEAVLPPIKAFAPGSPPSSGWKINLYRGMTPTGQPHASWECCIRQHAGAETWHRAPTAALAVLCALLAALLPRADSPNP